MPLTTLLISVVAVGTATLGTIAMRSERRRHAERRLALTALKELRIFLDLLAQHRGAANAFLNGDQTFKDRLRATGDKINASSRCLSGLLPDYPQWQTVLSGWKSLSQQLQGLTVAKSFEEHSRLLEQIARLMPDLCDQKDVWSGLPEELHHVLHTAVDQLPLLIDTLGQARGVGAGALAKNTVSAGVYIKLKFLHEHGLLLADRAAMDLRRLPADCDATIAPQVARARTASTQFLQRVEGELLHNRKPTANAQNYFDAATQAVNETLVLMDRLLDTTNRALQAA